MRRVNTIATRRIGGKGKHSGEPSASERKATAESPRNQPSRQRRLWQRPMPFHGSTEHLPTMARSFRLAAEIRNGSLCLGFASEAAMKKFSEKIEPQECANDLRNVGYVSQLSRTRSSGQDQPLEALRGAAGPDSSSRQLT